MKSIEKDPYEVLGVNKDAKLKEIKESYVKLVREYPPEKNPEKYKEIKKAYEILINNIKNEPPFVNERKIFKEMCKDTRIIDELKEPIRFYLYKDDIEKDDLKIKVKNNKYDIQNYIENAPDEIIESLYLIKLEYDKLYDLKKEFFNNILKLAKAQNKNINKSNEVNNSEEYKSNLKNNKPEIYERLDNNRKKRIYENKSYKENEKSQNNGWFIGGLIGLIILRNLIGMIIGGVIGYFICKNNKN